MAGHQDVVKPLTVKAVRRIAYLHGVQASARVDSVIDAGTLLRA